MAKTRAAITGWLLALILLWTVSAHADDKPKKVRLAYSGWEVGTAVSYVGIDGGIFKQHGLEVEEVFTRDAFSAGVHSLIGIDLLIGFGNPLIILQPIMAGADIVALGAHVSNEKYSMGVAPGIGAIKELKGKRIGISVVGGRSDLIARVILRRAGLDPNRDIEIVPVGLGPNRVAALSKNLVQGVPLNLDIADRAQQFGIKILEVKEVPLITAMLLTTRSFIKREEEAVRRFVKGYVAAMQFYVTHRNESIAIIGKYFSGTNPSQLETMYEVFARQLKPLPLPDREATQALIDVASGVNPKSKNLKPSDLFEPRFLEELQKSGFVDELYAEKISL